jgi:hypothetical protein
MGQQILAAVQVVILITLLKQTKVAMAVLEKS